MRITLRPYPKDKDRWQVDIRLMNPCDSDAKELRRRMVAPAGCDPKRARAWGEQRAAALLCELLGEEQAESLPAPRKEARRPRAKPVTLGEFYRARFEPEHVNLLKPATQDYYRKMWANHIGPALGELPLVAIDDDRLSAFRALLRSRLAASTANIVLAKVAKMLRFARKVRLIEALPHFERLREPRKRPKEVLSNAEIERLIAAARQRGVEALVIVLLALDVGLRVSEICALQWKDIDLHAGTVLVQRNVYDGEEQTPKGLIGKIALSSALLSALIDLRKEADHGALVLYRRSSHTGGEWAQHSDGSIWNVLNQLQKAAGLKKSGPHLLRHTSLTRLANLGASVYVIQAVARHTHLQTTQVYLHTQQTGLSREAATLLDRAAEASGFGNALATAATSAVNSR